jgi:Na+/alanine symporter
MKEKTYMNNSAKTLVGLAIAFIVAGVIWKILNQISSLGNTIFPFVAACIAFVICLILLVSTVRAK